MKRLLLAALLVCCSAAQAQTSISGATVRDGTLPPNKITAIGAGTVIGNTTGSSAIPSAVAAGSIPVTATGGTTSATLANRAARCLNPVDDFGAVGDGVTADDTALQNALTYVEGGEGRCIDGGQYKYAITSEKSVVPSNFATIKNLNIIVTGGTWNSGDFALTVGRTGVGSSKARDVVVTHIALDGAHLGTGGIHFSALAAAKVSSIKSIQFDEVQIRIGPDTPNDSNNTTDSVYSGMLAAECTYVFPVDPGDCYYTYSLRTAQGIHVSSSDVTITNSTASTSLISLYLGEFFNVKIVNSTFWNGPAKTDANSLTVYISEDASNYQLDGNRIDDGRLEVRGFQGHIVNNKFIQFNAANPLRFVATVAGETAGNLNFSNNTVQDSSAVTLSTEGAGSWGGYAGVVSNNLNPYTYDIITISGVGTQLGSLSASSGAAGTNRGLSLRTGTANRWALFASSTAESGSNAGSNLNLNRYSDSGAYIDTPLTVIRSTGEMRFTGVPVSLSGSSGTDRSFQYQTGGTNRWVTRASSGAEGGGNGGSNYFIDAYDDAGALLYSPFLITRSTGRITLSLGTTIYGADSNINASSNFATNINTGTSTGTVTIGNASAVANIRGTVNINNNLNGATNIGTGTTTSTVSIGGGANTVAIGSGTGGTNTIQGATSINASVNAATNIGTGTTTQDVTIGGASNKLVVGTPSVMQNATKLSFSGTAPTISSGFGTTPSIAANNGSLAFAVDVGTGGTASSGVVGLPAATTGWICSVNNVTAKAANRADQGTFQTAATTTTVTIQNQTISTGAALAWAASDIIQMSCTGY